MQRPRWTRDIGVDDIPTPEHARHTWPEARTTANEIEQVVPRGIPSYLIWSTLISLCFVFVLIIFLYRHDHFVSIVTVGTLGVFIIATLVLSRSKRVSQ